MNQRLQPDLFCFPLEIGAMASRRAVGEALVRALRPYEMTTFAIGACPHPGIPPGAFFVSNWASDVVQAEGAGGLALLEPVLRAVQQNAGPVSLSAIRQGQAGFTPTPAEQAALATGGKGRAAGLAVPMYGAQGYRGFAYVCGPGPDPDARGRIVIQFLLQHAHDRLRALHAARSEAAILRLSLREREILNAARHGLSDEEIAQATAITVRTVRFHFENARRKLTARNRTEAIATAVQLQLLGV
jgi:DNA-binding NarL/FixJ family response regulator